MKPNLQTTIATPLAQNARQREIERVTGIDRKTIRTDQQHFKAECSNSPGVATGSVEQIPPPWPPSPAIVTPSAYGPYREFIEAQARLRRNRMAINQDLVDRFGFDGAYDSVKCFANYADCCI